MTDPMDVAGFLVERTVRLFGEDVDLIAIYGSRALEQARPDSDLDIFFVPRDGRTPSVGRTFLLDGLLYDFWGIPWERLEGFATGTARSFAFAPSLVLNAKPLYTRTDAVAQRFEELRGRVRQLQEAEAGPGMRDRAGDAVDRMLSGMETLRLAARHGKTGDLRHAAYHVAELAWEALALANQVVFPRGFAKGLRQPDLFAERPGDAAVLVERMTCSDDPGTVLRTAEDLVASTREVVDRLRLRDASPDKPADRFHQAYPEIRDAIGKVLAACENGDALGAGACAYLIQREVMEALNDVTEGRPVTEHSLASDYGNEYRRLGLPILTAINPNDAEALHAAALTLDRMVRDYLQRESIELCEFDSLAELEAAMDQG